MGKILPIFLVMIILSGCSNVGDEASVSDVGVFKNEIITLQARVDEQSALIKEFTTSLALVNEELAIANKKIELISEETEGILYEYNEQQKDINQLSYFFTRFSILRRYIENTEDYHVSYGWIEKFSDLENYIEFDDREWVSVNDTRRIEELESKTNLDFPNGYALYNEKIGLKTYSVHDEILIYTLSDEYDFVEMNSSSFETFINNSGYNIFCEIVFSQGQVIAIIEKYIP